MDWSVLYPDFVKPLSTNSNHDDEVDSERIGTDSRVEFLDIGCGYGGLLGK